MAHRRPPACAGTACCNNISYTAMNKPGGYNPALDHDHPFPSLPRRVANAVMDHCNPARPSVRLADEHIRWRSKFRAQQQTLNTPGPARRALRACGRLSPARVRRIRLSAVRVAVDMLGIMAGMITLFVVYALPLWPRPIALVLAVLTLVSVVSSGALIFLMTLNVLNPRNTQVKHLKKNTTPLEPMMPHLGIITHIGQVVAGATKAAALELTTPLA